MPRNQPIQVRQERRQTIALVLSVDLPGPESWQHFSVYWTPGKSGFPLTAHLCHSPRNHHRYGPWICVYWDVLWDYLLSLIQRPRLKHPLRSGVTPSLMEVGSMTDPTPQDPEEGRRFLALLTSRGQAVKRQLLEL